MSNPEFGEKLSQLYPVVEPEMSDSGCLDNVVEFLGLFTLFVYFYTTAICLHFYSYLFTNFMQLFVYILVMAYFYSQTIDICLHLRYS